MSKRVKWMIAALACVVLFVGIYFLYDYLLKENDADPFLNEETSQQEDSSSQTVDSHKAPDFKVLDASGKEVRLSDYRGKPIVLNFWATWCYYCKEEMPDFNAAYRKHPDIQFMMVNVTDGYKETKENAEKYVEQEGFEFPVFYDTTLEAASTYGASGLPMTVFIDKNGDLVTYASGKLSAENLEKGIERIQ